VEPSQHAQVMTLLDSAHHMIEIDSVMKPMASQWVSQSRNAGFWEWRRTRPLTDWVPLGPNARRALVAGWLVGRLFGLTRYSETGHKPGLEALRNGSWYRFGSGTGTGTVRAVTEESAVGNLLEALPVTMLDAYQNQQLDSLEPFGELIRLGAGMEGPANVVTRWIWEGIGFGDTAEAIVRPGESEDARRAALLDACEALEQTHREDVSPERLQRITEAQKNPSFELTNDILEALDGIREAARHERRRGVR